MRFSLFSSLVTHIEKNEAIEQQSLSSKHVRNHQSKLGFPFFITEKEQSQAETPLAFTKSTLHHGTDSHY